MPSSSGFGRSAALFDSTDYPIQPDFIAAPVEVLYQANNIGPLFAQGSTSAPHSMPRVKRSSISGRCLATGSSWCASIA